MKSLLLLIALILSLVITGFILFKRYSENFCIEGKTSRDWESYYNTSHNPKGLYKDSFKLFIEKVDNDKKENHSILGSVQNPMSDRNHNTRILYQEGEDVYKF